MFDTPFYLVHALPFADEIILAVRKLKNSI